MNRDDNVRTRLHGARGLPILGHARRASRWCKVIFTCGIGLAVATSFLGCGKADHTTTTATAPTTTTAPAANTVSVSMHDMKFSPGTVEVKQGGTVQWTNDDLVPHTATSPSFNSGTLSSGQTWKHTFTDAGTYPYICKLHPRMTGTVVVK